MSSMIVQGDASSLGGALERARTWSPFLRLLIDRDPHTAQALAQGTIDLAGDTGVEALADVSVGTRLRRRRRAVALSVAIGDLAGVLSFEAVTGALSDFADAALDAAIRAAIEERTPGATAVGFTAIALGKQGSRELNYSSDIDPILLYDPVTLPRRRREDPADAAVRIARRVVELLQARDGDGYVLRVDLRLRPSPEATPLALPIGAAISYYESQALAWERAAFIRARAAAGDVALGQGFLAAIRPFVWRRSLDFGAIAEIRAITHRIRAHYASSQRFGAGYDLKRGRGGIREVEFFAQVHQLIHGGRDSALRAPATLDALAALAAAGWIDHDAAADLGAAYRLLRTIEHRVQMVDDRQTHQLPGGETLDGVARLHGVADGAALLALLAPHVERVGTVYDAIDTPGRVLLPHDPGQLGDALTQAGFADGPAAARRVAMWRGGRYPALRSDAAQRALEAVLPGLVASLGAAPDPLAVLVRLDALLERLPSAINLFRLLEARPGLATLLIAILRHAAPLADDLGRRPSLLDGLIDATALAPVSDLATLRAAMTPTDRSDYQGVLDHVRRVVGEMRFALGVQIVAAAADPLSVAAGYAHVAEAAVDTLAAATVDAFAAVHGRVRDSEFVIVALGRFGGAAMTHASDLDLVYLFTGDFRDESDGVRPLGATLYYNRLAQRLTAALSVPTAAGPLYAVDLRLRPSGAKGPLAVSLDSFARYQAEQAWTWERMALTRARPVYGSPRARAQVTAAIGTALAANPPARGADAIVADARTMRADMARHKPPAGPLDVKLLPGGLVDLEFATHVTQLVHRAAVNPSLPVAIAALINDGLLPAALIDANAFLTSALVTLRLLAPGAEVPDAATCALVAEVMALPNWDAVMRALDAARRDVAAAWHAVSKG